MNFLLHHHFAARELGSPLAAVGAMLPDLWRMADRRVRPAREGVALPDDPDTQHVLSGIAHHLAIDRWFHESAAFREGEQATRLLFRSLEVPRLPLFAHVAWEMCLDGALLTRLGTDAMLETLRRDLDPRTAAFRAALELHHFARSGEPRTDRGSFDARMTEICRELQGGPWIVGYLDGEGLALRILGVRTRLGMPPISTAGLARLAAVMDELTRVAPAALDQLLCDRVAIADASKNV